MIGVIAVRRARIRRGAPAEGRARGRAGCGSSGSRIQAPPHRRGGHPAGPAIHRLQHTLDVGTAGALRGDERQHISGPDLCPPAAWQPP